jgi:hypothetical protein
MPSLIENYAQEAGLTLVDAGKPLEIEIKTCDVKGSKSLNPKQCAIARALVRIGFEEAWVFRNTVWVDDGKGHLVRYSLPSSLQKEVVAFDRGAKFFPGEYHLGPSPNRKRNRRQRAGEHPQREARRRAKLAIKKKKIHRTQGIRGTEWES